jgi:glycosyltransferase involved in cell wall biosynthesis
MTSNGSDRVLFVSPGPSIADPESGEGARLHHLSQHLAEEWEVYTLVPDDIADEPPTWVQRQYTYSQWSMPFLTDLNPSFLRGVRRAIRDASVDVVHVSTGVCAARLAAALDGDVTVVYAAQNVEADHAQDFVDPDLPAHKRLFGPRLIPLVERASVTCADGLTTVSEKDRERFVERYGVNPDRVRAIPTGTESIDGDSLEDPIAVRDRYGLGDGPVAVFHGYYEHPPNREAAEVIDEQIAPALRERGVDLEFLLVGKGAPEVSSRNVHTVGFVDDLYSVLGAADLAVVPILHGGGTKTKVYDYVSLGLPIVATEKGLEGIDLEDGRHALVTAGANEPFTEGIERLVTDGDLSTELSKNLQQLAEEWSWDRSAERLETFYRWLS